MEFAFTPEQEELRRQARAFLEANADAPLAELRDLGWLGVSVPEERGGGGLSFVDEAILFEEAGRALYSGPFLTTAVVLPALPEVDGNTWSVETDAVVVSRFAPQAIANPPWPDKWPWHPVGSP